MFEASTPNLLLDANLLTVLVAGRLSPKLLGRHKRLRSYREPDFAVLSDAINRYRRVRVIPNVVTEAANLLSQCDEDTGRVLRVVMADLLAGVTELYIASSAASAVPSYHWLGLTDAALLLALDAEHSLLTADLRLHHEALRAGAQSINFNHLRDPIR